MLGLWDYFRPYFGSIFGFTVLATLLYYFFVCDTFSSSNASVLFNNEKLEEKDLIFLYPFLELLFMIFYFIFIVNRMIKKKRFW